MEPQYSGAFQMPGVCAGGSVQKERGNYTANKTTFLLHIHKHLIPVTPLFFHVTLTSK